MPQTLTRPGSPLRRAVRLPDVVTLLAAAAVAIVFVPSLDDGPRRDMTFGNSTEWIIAVELVSDGGSRLPLATLRPGSTTKVEEIPAAGDTWRVRFRFAGDQLATVERTDDELRGAGDRIDVPDDVADQLRERGIPPSA